ncbi:MAG: N-acetyltransferase [Treponema sp.]|jgi:predicted N-acetyltransferase YhbS|nr:N-acetyltransferase [Treponema sp.]
MNILLRLEEEGDYGIVEEITREAFWNVYVPGCVEHLLVHRLRQAKEFVNALDFVAVCDDAIVGNIVYVTTKIIDEHKEHTVLTFGPVSVPPEYQRKGIGKSLINHTKALAKEMNYKAILLYGDPEYYKKYGFKESKAYGITNKEGKFPAALLALELYPGALNGIKGVYDEGAVYEINEDAVKEFEKRFTRKEKGITKTQERFNELSKTFV